MFAGNGSVCFLTHWIQSPHIQPPHSMFTRAWLRHISCIDANCASRNSHRRKNTSCFSHENRRCRLVWALRCDMGRMSKTAILDAEALTKCFGQFTAVDRANLSVASGEVFGSAGPNGAGKTTVIVGAKVYPRAVT